jgi:hypothetical protein
MQTPSSTLLVKNQMSAKMGAAVEAMLPKAAGLKFCFIKSYNYWNMIAVAFP